MVWEIIVKYWVQFLLGIIASGLTALCTHFYNLYKREKASKQTELEKKFVQEVKDLISNNNKEVMKVIREEELAANRADEMMGAQMNSIQNELKILTEGMLSVQGRQFKEDCRAMLKDEHVITLQEYENLTREHETYNALKGNHEGDSLFSLVKVKYEATLK